MSACTTTFHMINSVISVGDEITATEEITPVKFTFDDSRMSVDIPFKCYGYNDYRKESYSMGYKAIACCYNYDTKELAFIGTLDFNSWDVNRSGDIVSEPSGGTCYNMGACVLKLADNAESIFSVIQKYSPLHINVLKRSGQMAQ